MQRASGPLWGLSKAPEECWDCSCHHDVSPRAVAVGAQSHSSDCLWLSPSPRTLFKLGAGGVGRSGYRCSSPCSCSPLPGGASSSVNFCSWAAEVDPRCHGPSLLMASCVIISQVLWPWVSLPSDEIWRVHVTLGTVPGHEAFSSKKWFFFPLKSVTNSVYLKGKEKRRKGSPMYWFTPSPSLPRICRSQLGPGQAEAMRSQARYST